MSNALKIVLSSETIHPLGVLTNIPKTASNVPSAAGRTRGHSLCQRTRRVCTHQPEAKSRATASKRERGTATSLGREAARGFTSFLPSSFPFHPPPRSHKACVPSLLAFSPQHLSCLLGLSPSPVSFARRTWSSGTASGSSRPGGDADLADHRHRFGLWGCQKPPKPLGRSWLAERSREICAKTKFVFM